MPQQDALIAAMPEPGNVSEPEGCMSAKVSSDRIPLERQTPSTILCIHTAQGNVSELQFIRLPGGLVLELRLRTWQP